MIVKSVFVSCVCLMLHLTQGEIVDCPYEGIAYLPHSKCNQFNICLDGEAAEMMCPFGLYYNPDTTQCDFPENVSACRGGTRPPIDLTTTSTEEPSTTTELPPGEMTECGQAIVANNGTIQYKLNENYDAGELCVFTIQFKSDKRRNSTFFLETHGFSDSNSTAVTIIRRGPVLTAEANLGFYQKNVTFAGYGAFVIFRTNSTSGTGFRLSFETSPIENARLYTGTHAVFENERDSPLKIPYPFNFTNETIYNHFVFMSGSKIISEPDTIFTLTSRGVFGNEVNSCWNFFLVYSFADELKQERQICMNDDDWQLFEFRTRGIFIIYQSQYNHLPTTSGTITWEKISLR